MTIKQFLKLTEDWDLSVNFKNKMILALNSNKEEVSFSDLSKQDARWCEVHGFDVQIKKVMVIRL